MNLASLLLGATKDTLYIITVATILSYVGGFPLGVILTLCRNEGFYPKPAVYRILDGIINIIRSIPFIILIIALTPFTRILIGTSIGINATIVSLVIGAIPFVARIVETALIEVDSGVIEAAMTMGADVKQLIFKVLLREAFPTLLKGLSITIIMLIGYSAMAGVVGGGGLGDVAIRYGYYRYDYNIMIYTLVILVVMVQIVQSGINILTRRVDKRNIKS